MANCYMCEQKATGVEHVPPRCLFPEQKDLPAGIDLRKQLITVPACDEHNSAKSKDDEYLLYLLAINLPANEVAKEHFFSKIIRAIQRNPKLINQFTATKMPVFALDKDSGEVHKTIAVRIDDDRLNSSLDHISRALYFHHFREKWTGSVMTQPDFLLSTLDPGEGQKLNELGALMVQAADQIFATCVLHGYNPEVFKYQVHEGGDSVHKLMRLHFYNGCRVSVFFGADG